MKHLNIAQESIEFQSTAFFKELTLAFEDLQKTKPADVKDSEVVGNLSKIIQHRTGLNVTIDIGDLSPCVDIPAVNKNNVLINSFQRNFLNSSDGLKMITAAGGVARGTANLNTAKVTGLFSEVQSTVHLPLRMFERTTFTPDEIAAITLHELGHLFTYYEFMCRSITTNQALAGMSKALDASGTVEEREAVFITVKKAMNLSDLDAKALAKSNDTKVAEIVVLTNVTKAAESELGSNIYDFSTWEYLSDQFATRQGAGRSLATALEKIYRGAHNISFRSTPSFLSMEALKVILVLAPIVAPNLFAVGATLWLGGHVISFGLTLMAMDGSGDGTYDRPGARIKRVRNQIVENMKKKELTKDDHERLAADLEVIDQMLGNINDRYQLVEVIWNTCSPTARRAINQQKLQQDLEAIASNDLFVKAAQLKQLVN